MYNTKYRISDNKQVKQRTRAMIELDYEAVETNDERILQFDSIILK